MSVNSQTKAYQIVRNYVALMFEPLWVMTAFTVTALLFSILIINVPSAEQLLGTTMGQLFSSGALYVIALAIVVVPLVLLRGKDYVKRILGIHKLPTRSILWLPFVLWLAYMVVTIIVAAVTSNLPFVDSDQVQDVGFTDISVLYEYILVFIALVILPPVAEELLFRGYLFGRIRERFGFWLTTIVVSVVFGIVHMQWNVGIDVAVLSIFLCYLREKTGTIWASMVLHAIKNGVAYVLLFIAPLFGYSVL
ncbi:MAG: type II CAAX endopeptidase family protein [Candidatus Saccharimonadales bacterium]